MSVRVVAAAWCVALVAVFPAVQPAPSPTPAPSASLRGVVLGGRVWYDADKDGRRGWGDGPLAGITVTLLGADGSPLRYPGKSAAVVTTGTSGRYSFVVAPNTSYRLRFDPGAGADLVPTLRGVGDSFRDSDPDPDSLTVAVETGTDGQVYTTVDAGFFRVQRPTMQRLVNGERGGPDPIVVPLGSTVRLSFVITNRDVAPLDDIEVVDDAIGAVACPARQLAAHGSMTCEGTAEAQPGLDAHQAVLTARAGGASLTPVVVSGGLFTQARLEVRKVAEDGSTPLHGAVFEVRDGEPAGPVVARITTGRDGVAAATGLDAGPKDAVGPKRYCVVEVGPPDGYELAPRYLTGQCARTNAAAPVLSFSVSDPPVTVMMTGPDGLDSGSALRSWFAAAWLLLLFGALVLVVLAVVARRSSRLSE